jgi:hypothetical protein
MEDNCHLDAESVIAWASSSEPGKEDDVDMFAKRIQTTTLREEFFNKSTGERESVYSHLCFLFATKGDFVRLRRLFDTMEDGKEFCSLVFLVDELKRNPRGLPLDTMFNMICFLKDSLENDDDFSTYKPEDDPDYIAYMDRADWMRDYIKKNPDQVLELGYRFEHEPEEACGPRVHALLKAEVVKNVRNNPDTLLKHMIPFFSKDD